MLKKSIGILAFLTFLFLLWEWAVRLSSDLLFVVPAPSSILATIWEMRSRFWLHTSVTFKEMCGGFLLALLAAFPLAWTMMRFRSSRTILQPLFIIIQCIPMFTLAPIMVIWFGWGYTAIVIPTALMIFFPLTLNIYQGLRSTPQDLLEFFQTNRATGLQTFFKLRLPWALPHIFAGFRISAAIAGVGAVAGEWAGAQNGLGILMLESRRNTDLEITFAALFCLTTMSTLLYLSILACEKLSLSPAKWKAFLSSFSLLNWKKPKLALTIPLLLFASCLIGVMGCQRSEKNHKISLLLDWLPNPNHVPLYVGIQKGFFAEEQIPLEIQKMHDSGGGISYLTSRKANLLVNHMPGVYRAAARGADLKIVGVLIKQPLTGLIYREDLEIEKPSDLTGHILGYCLGGPDTAYLDFLLDRGNITPSEKKNVSVDLISSMGTKNVDYIYGGFWNIEPFQLKMLGLPTKTVTIEELGVPSYYEMVVVANGPVSLAFASSFQRALQKSIDFCKDHPDEAFSCYLAANPDKRLQTINWEKEAWDCTCPLLAKNQNVDPKVLRNFYQWQLSQHILPKPFPYQNLICH
ncbi:MAG: putative thiamine biosynthesis protein [Chlamydiae bacterium]|nr:putative thiamine biosynthesis protein [Chlamydiota bacterium]